MRVAQQVKKCYYRRLNSPPLIKKSSSFSPKILRIICGQYQIEHNLHTNPDRKMQPLQFSTDFPEYLPVYNIHEQFLIIKEQQTILQ